MLVDAVNDMRAELKSKPSTEQVESMIAHLVSQRDHDAHTFRIEQQGKDLERLAKEVQTGIASLKAELLEKIQENSPKRLRENITAVVALLTGVLSLLVALGLFKRP
jgi:restriction endonuclease Mrr